MKTLLSFIVIAIAVIIGLLSLSFVITYFFEILMFMFWAGIAGVAIIAIIGIIGMLCES